MQVWMCEQNNEILMSLVMQVYNVAHFEGEGKCVLSPLHKNFKRNDNNTLVEMIKNGLSNCKDKTHFHIECFSRIHIQGNQ